MMHLTRKFFDKVRRYIFGADRRLFAKRTGVFRRSALIARHDKRPPMSEAHSAIGDMEFLVRRKIPLYAFEPIAQLREWSFISCKKVARFYAQFGSSNVLLFYNS